MQFSGKRVTVAGLGRFGGGIAVARWLCAQGAKVLVTDRDTPGNLADSVRQLGDLPMEFRLGEHREEDFTNTELVVASPALPPHNLFLQAARGAGVTVTTEIRLFVERCGAKMVGVTGTKGKSTTTAMLGRILTGAGIANWVGGNIGKSLLEDLPRIKESDVVVLELSSFMLEHLRESRWSPHVALITMVSADHLDWHGSLENYVEAKKNIFSFQGPGDYLVLNERDPVSAAFAGDAPGKVVYYGKSSERFDLMLPGEHNQLNAQGAFAAAAVLGATREAAEMALADFAGLPHRLELVCESGGVRYFNDSIATIPEAAIAALQSFPPKKVIQIIGGYDKGLAVTGLCAALVERSKAALCIGATGPTLAKMMEESPSQSAASAYQCGDLGTAMKMARQIAVPGDIVLLSPGFASYDQFVNFQQRGEEFARLARGAN